MRIKPIIFAMQLNRERSRICPVGCPYQDPSADPWGCENCRRDEDKFDAQQVDTEIDYDKKAQEDWG